MLENKYKRRQAVQYMFMSENICTMVDLFDKAVAGGGGGEIITVERKSEGDNQT